MTKARFFEYLERLHFWVMSGGTCTTHTKEFWKEALWMTNVGGRGTLGSGFTSFRQLKREFATKTRTHRDRQTNKHLGSVLMLLLI